MRARRGGLIGFGRIRFVVKLMRALDFLPSGAQELARMIALTARGAEAKLRGDEISQPEGIVLLLTQRFMKRPIEAKADDDRRTACVFSFRGPLFSRSNLFTIFFLAHR